MLTPHQQKWYWENKIESDKYFWYFLGVAFLGTIIFAIAFLFIISYGLPANAQEIILDEEKATSTPPIFIEKTDTEKLIETKLDLEDKNILASKYAALYDSCKNIKQQILNVLQ